MCIRDRFKNDIFAGSSVCTTDGTFSFEIDLLAGQNTLVARVFDALNQVGPDSNSVVVYYDAPANTSSPFAQLNFGGPQLLLNTDAVFRGAFPVPYTHLDVYKIHLQGYHGH